MSDYPVPESSPEALNSSTSPVSERPAVRSRNEPFVARAATRIWQEQPSAANPYIATAARCYGYDLLELMQKRSFVDVFYLLMRGDLPEPEQAQLLEQLMIAMIHPGPRHPAARAAMNAAVGKTDPLHILPIATAVMGGEHMGGGAVEAAMRFFHKSNRSDPAALVAHCCDSGDWSLPGFGQIYGGRDALSAQLAEHLLAAPAAGAALRWGQRLQVQLEPYQQGWLSLGVAAAALCDLGFQPRAGGVLLQLLSAPGLAAQGLELANKPITAMPFVKDENYVIAT